MTFHVEDAESLFQAIERGEIKPRFYPLPAPTFTVFFPATWPWSFKATWLDARGVPLRCRSWRDGWGNVQVRL